MEHDPSRDHTLDEKTSAESERNIGVLTAGVIALTVVGTAIYWVT